MKREIIDMSQERSIIIMMIVSTDFLNQIAPITKSKYFKSRYAQIVSEWIIEYWTEFKEAPEKTIQDVYKTKMKTLHDEEDTESIMQFLKKLSETWEKSSIIQNIDFQIKNTVHYLKIRSLEVLTEEIKECIMLDDPVSGEHKITEYNQIEKQGIKGIRILQDYEPITEAFLNESETIFRFDGALGKVCGSFQRGDLVAFLAAPKRGKSWWQWTLSYMSMFYGKRVVFFSLEMTERQVLRRGWQSITGQTKEPMEVSIPVFIENGEEKFKIIHKKQKKKGVDISKIQKEQKKLNMYCRGGDVLIKVMPANSVTVDMIEMELDNIYHYNNFLPDIVIVDYADILKASIRGEYRHQIDHIWKGLRKIAQDRDVLVVSASQATRGALKRDAKMGDIAEDVRKLGHVSKLVAINQSEEDRENQGIRIQLLAERDGPCTTAQAYVLYCYEIGKPCLDSRLLKNVILPKKTEQD